MLILRDTIDYNAMLDAELRNVALYIGKERKLLKISFADTIERRFAIHNIEDPSQKR